MQEKIPEPIINSTTCLRLYHGSNVYGEIYPWYQIRHVKVSWSGVKVCNLVNYVRNFATIKFNLVVWHSH